MFTSVEKIGFTCSSFDLLHAGHILMLEESKSHCETLIVGLQTDPCLDRDEKDTPVQSVYERYIQLSAIKYVDKIIPYDTERSLYNLLKTQKIDIRFLGEDYLDKPYTGQNLGIPIHFCKRKHDFSTTNIKSDIKLDITYRDYQRRKD